MPAQTDRRSSRCEDLGPSRSRFDSPANAYLALLGMRSEKLKGNLDLLLLSVLSSGPGHGYSIITRLRDRSGGAFDLPEGTVYPALHRLEQAGLLDSSWEQVAGRRRRIYRITPTGERALADEAREWMSFSKSVAMVLGR
jgi:PadR family transcriptional regulator, regulatory protein PadR